MDLIKLGDENVDELLEAQVHVWNHTYRFISSMALKCAVEQEIPDIIQNHGQPMSISDLASVLRIHPSKLHALNRLMRILLHSGFIANKENGYVLTPASRLLLKDNPLSARSLLLLELDPINMKSWDHLTPWFQNDDPSPFITAHGENIYGCAANDPRLNQLFNDAMVGDSMLVATVVVTRWKHVFEGLKSLVDVAGGNGTLTKVIADTFPQMDVTVFDLPHVIEGLQASGNLKYVAGNMFEKVPPAYAILLKWILIDWSHEECIKILTKCKEAIWSGGKIIIIDGVIKNQEVDEESMETKLLFDIDVMAVTTAGYEKNEQEWSKLFADAGFSDYRMHHTKGLKSLIELFP